MRAPEIVEENQRATSTLTRSADEDVRFPVEPGRAAGGEAAPGASVLNRLGEHAGRHDRQAKTAHRHGAMLLLHDHRDCAPPNSPAGRAVAATRAALGRLNRILWRRRLRAAPPHRLQFRRPIPTVPPPALAYPQVGGYLAHSLAIITDAAHMLSDIAGFLVGVLSIFLTSRAADPKYSFGYHIAEVQGDQPPFHT